MSEEELTYGFAEIEGDQGSDFRSDAGGDQESEEDETNFEDVENIAVEHEDSDLDEGGLFLS